jgi:hypothetical protein
MKTLPGEAYKALMDNIVATVKPPPEIGSWTHHVDSVIVLGIGGDTHLLQMAAESVFGKYISAHTDKCIAYWEIAARGAALRARDWIEYYDASYPTSNDEEEEEEEEEDEEENN